MPNMIKNKTDVSQETIPKPNVHQSLASLAKMVFDTDKEYAIFLPDFQRPFVWDIKQQSDLIISFLIGVPLGSLMLFEGRREQYLSKKIGTIQDHIPLNPSDQNVLYLLDGQQRVTSLMSVFFDWFDGKSKGEIEDMLKRSHRKKKTLYESLQLRWFIDLKKDMDHVNIFSANGLEFESNRFFADPDAEDLEYSKIIVPERISNSNGNVAYHPNNYLRDQSDLIEYCVDNLRIPLFMLSNKWRPTLDSILSKIEQRLMKEQCLTDSHNWADEVSEYLNETRINDETYFLLDITPISRISRSFYSFSKRNRSGMDLKAFDLLTARAASKFYELNNVHKLEEQEQSCNLQVRIIDELKKYAGKDIKNIEYELSSLDILNDRELSNRFKEVFSQLICVYSVYMRGKNIDPEHTKTTGIIAHTTREDVYENYIKVTLAILKAAIYCKKHFGVDNIKDFAFRPIFLPIAFAFSILSEIKENQQPYLASWYWSTMFSLEYGKDSSTSAARDCKDLLNLLDGHKVSSRLADRVLNVFNYDLFRYTEGYINNLQMTGNNLENTSSQRSVISRFVLSKSTSNIHVSTKEANLCKGLKQYNIFDHPLNSTCESSTIDHQLLEGVDPGEIALIRALYIRRSQQLIKLVRETIQPLKTLIDNRPT